MFRSEDASQCVVVPLRESVVGCMLSMDEPLHGVAIVVEHEPTVKKDQKLQRCESLDEDGTQLLVLTR